MKSLILFLVVSSSSQPVSVKQGPDQWAPVSDYLSKHSTNYDANIDARLCEEAHAGIQTWTVSAASHLARASDPNLGWPSEPTVLRFGSITELATASQMILDVTYSRRTR